MKKNKFFINMVIITIVMITASCKKTFLDESLTTARSMEYYNTDAGILSLVNGTYYAVFNTPFNGEFAFSNMCYGTDEFHLGGDNSNAAYNSYGNGLASFVSPVNSNTITANAQWDNLYFGIGYANLIIQNATASVSTDNAIKRTALGEGYFFRAYSYLRLVSQYGAVPLKTKPSTSCRTGIYRACSLRIYIHRSLPDFTQAYNLFRQYLAGPAKITKDAVASFFG
jgi:hypothetical protein